MGDDHRRAMTPAEGYPAVTLQMIKGVKKELDGVKADLAVARVDLKSDIVRVDNRVTEAIGVVSNQVSNLRTETKDQSESLARIETSLAERKAQRRAVTEVKKYGRAKNIALLGIVAALISLTTALITHYAGG